MNIFKKLRHQWDEASVDLASPASAREVSEFERRHGVTLPVDVKDYLTTVGGMSNGETDKYLISFASLASLDDPSRWVALSGSRKGLIFADYSLFAHYYVLDTGTGAVLVDDGELSQKLAETFHEFIESYLEDAASVANCWTTNVPTK